MSCSLFLECYARGAVGNVNCAASYESFFLQDADHRGVKFVSVHPQVAFVKGKPYGKQCYAAYAAVRRKSVYHVIRLVVGPLTVVYLGISWLGRRAHAEACHNAAVKAYQIETPVGNITRHGLFLRIAVSPLHVVAVAAHILPRLVEYIVYLWPQIFKFLFAAQLYLRSYVFCNGRAVVFRILFHIRLLAHIVFFNDIQR